MQELPPQLARMGEYNQFILWGADKVPLNPYTGVPANAHDTNSHCDFETACMLAKIHGKRVGFVFTKNDPFFFFDIDGCVNDDGTWTEIAENYMSYFSDCAIERSQSGKGLHIFGTCDKSVPHKTKNVPEHIELYTENRYVALTGDMLASNGDCTVRAQNYSWLIDSYFAGAVDMTSAEWTTSPVEEWEGHEVDDELILKACAKTGNPFMPEMVFSDLWFDNGLVIGTKFPHIDKEYDESSADQSLCNMLAFWTGKDCERIERLWMRSALVREKSIERKKYRQDTILKACASCTDVHKLTGDKYTAPEVADTVEVLDTPNIVEEAGDGHVITHRVGSSLLDAGLQEKLFKGCVYVADKHVVIDGTGRELQEKQFKVIYGGWKFMIDTTGEKTSRNAFEAFTNNEAVSFPKVDTQCFRPVLKPNQIVNDGTQTMVNAFHPPVVKSVEGDASPFVNHIKKMLPVERDFQIFMSYLASTVQNVGHKIRWCTLLQGCEGNGKSLITHVMNYALSSKYVHTPNALDIANKFNQWLERKLCVIIEEIDTKDKAEISEWLKPVITNDRVEFQGKGTNQYTGDNCANFILFTNVKGAIKVSMNDRRYCIFYTNQQSEKDIIRDGMDGQYFPDLYDWLRAGGFAIVTNYLRTFKIAKEFDPINTLHRAPKSSSYDEVVEHSKGYPTIRVSDAIENEEDGTRGGYLSSNAIRRAFKDGNVTYSNKKLTQVVQELGYIVHPILSRGRLSGGSKYDVDSEKRAVIYCTTFHPSIAGKWSVSEITKDYNNC